MINLRPSFHSSLTHRNYATKCENKKINVINCATSNCIYLITFGKYGLQYVGETAQSLRDRFSGHRTGMKNPFADNRCKILSKNFSIKKTKKETKWMLTFQTVDPYSLNDRVGDEYMVEKDSRVVGNKFLPLHRLHKRLEYNYSKINLIILS